MSAPSSLTGAIVRVGDGRGFVVEQRHRHARVVITAAHCLPKLPPAHPGLWEKRIYPALLGPLDGEPTITAECLFVDPVADVAVVGEPDSQSLDEANDAYLAFIENATPLRVGVLSAASEAWLLTLAGAWESCTVRLSNPYGPARALTLIDAVAGNAPGCSGSPIIASDGRAVGVVSLGVETRSHDGATVASPEQGGQPLLATMLPLWLLSEMRVNVGRAHAVCRAYVGEIRRVIDRGKSQR